MEENAEDWKGLGEYISLLNLEGIQFRRYQYNIIKAIIEKGNTLVVLPTGLGKTLIGAALVAKAIYEGKHALFLAPTKPLTEQHFSTLKGLLKLPNEDIALITGSIRKKERTEMEKKAKVIIATPQTIANDLKSGDFSLLDFGVAVFDECHHAIGKYAYTYIANELAARGTLIVGLTASPGSKPEKVMELVNTLNIRHIEARTSMDDDVKEYVMPKYMHTISVELSEHIKYVAGLVKSVGEESLAQLRQQGFANFKSIDSIPKGRLIELGNELKKINAPGYRFGLFFNYVKLLHSVHAYDLLVTEGVYPFVSYLESLESREVKSRAVKSFIHNTNIIQALNEAKKIIDKGEEHPKVNATLQLLTEYRQKACILFAQYRSTIKMLVEKLNQNGFLARAFVGKKEGITQEQQKQTIEDFRAGKFNILVASSIGEEGLDIPSVDLVVFYEPIPNEIRNIQRKGRTGRFRAGDIFILLTKGTKDEIYFFVSRSRERKIAALLAYVNRKLETIQKGQTKLITDL